MNISLENKKTHDFKNQVTIKITSKSPSLQVTIYQLLGLIGIFKEWVKKVLDVAFQESLRPENRC